VTRIFGILILIASSWGCSNSNEFNCSNGEDSADYSERLTAAWAQDTVKIYLQFASSLDVSNIIITQDLTDDSIVVDLDLRADLLFDPTPQPSSRMWSYGDTLIIDLQVLTSAQETSGASVDCISASPQISVKQARISLPTGVSPILLNR
jgi:hypothetical protein